MSPDHTIEQHTFLTPLLERGCAYLVQMKERGIWGHFSGTSIDLYHAYISLSCLATLCRDGFAKYGTMPSLIANVELSAKATYEKQLGTLGLRDLSYLLLIMRLLNETDNEFVDKLKEALTKRVDERLSQPQTISIRDLSLSLLALSRAGSVTDTTVDTTVKAGAHYLRSLQNDKDGGWAFGSGGESPLVPTCQAIEALREADRAGCVDVIARGEAYLENCVERFHWGGLAGGNNIYVQATVLRALAGSSNHVLVSDGIESLKAGASDEGWGMSPGQPTAIEPTACVLMALADCGENKFVSYRIAAARLDQEHKQNKRLSAELTLLKQNMDDRVTKESGKILGDRDSWRKKAKELEKKVEKLEEPIRTTSEAMADERLYFRAMLENIPKVIHERQNKERGSARDLRIFEITTATLAVVTLSYFLVQHYYQIIDEYGLVFQFRYISYGLLSFVVISLYVALYLWLRRRRALWRAIYLQDTLWDSPFRTSSVEERLNLAPISMVVQEYFDIARQIPPSLREELYYLVMGRLVDMPKDVGLKIAGDLVERLALPSFIERTIVSWVVNFLELDNFSRRAVSEQIRRQEHTR